MSGDTEFVLETENETKTFKNKEELKHYITTSATRYGGWDFIDTIFDTEGNEYGVKWTAEIVELNR